MTPEEIKQVAKERGWEHAAFMEAYEVSFLEESDIPEGDAIEIPYYAESEPDLFRDNFQEGFREYMEENYLTR